MTRAHARAIENEVNSFLFEFRLDLHEDWVLPYKDMLCILSYQGDDHVEAKKDLFSPDRVETKEDLLNPERAVLPPAKAVLPLLPTSGTTAP